MKCGMWPIARRCRQSMMDRVEVDVVEMCGEVAVVADQMFPKPSLPDIPLTSRAIDFGALRHANALHIGSGEGFFDQPPPCRVVGVMLRELPA